MSKSRRRKSTSPSKATSSAGAGVALRDIYDQAKKHAEGGENELASKLYQSILRDSKEPLITATAQNDLAVLAAIAGNYLEAEQLFDQALAVAQDSVLFRENLKCLRDGVFSERERNEGATASAPSSSSSSKAKIAIVSLLFNFPSAGGGNIHTAEFAHFLTEAGFEVRHFYAKYEPWQIGNAQGVPYSYPLLFDIHEWKLPTIQGRFRQAVDAFGPDYVLITDSWNCKPHLALAMKGYPVFLRFQALECLCPLNNVRLLALGDGRWGQCTRQQLATPLECVSCLRERGRFSGGLHKLERELAGVGTPEYHALLLESLQQAEALLVFNPWTETMLSPYAKRVHVVPWGMDPKRFPWSAEAPRNSDRPRKTLFQAGVLNEPMKGFEILHEACARLWQKRQDFELVGTGEPEGQVDSFTRFIGWKSQEELPQSYRDADIVVVPTIAQEGLSRTSVEAMAAGKPVVASRIGGLPVTVTDEVTGLLCEPGNAEDLARKLDALLDDAGMRERMGLAGRKRFEEHFSWPVVIQRHYRPLFPARHTKTT